MCERSVHLLLKDLFNLADFLLDLAGEFLAPALSLLPRITGDFGRSLFDIAF
jgi:hypothetical protein